MRARVVDAKSGVNSFAAQVTEMASRIVLVLVLALGGSNAFGPTIPQCQGEACCPSEATRECLYDTGEPAEACTLGTDTRAGACTEAGALCDMYFAPSLLAWEGMCFATETDDAFICACCGAGPGYEDASGNVLPKCRIPALDELI